MLLKENGFNVPNTFKADENGRTLGFISLYANDFENSIAYITFLVVDPEFRSMGVGSRLMEFSEGYVRKPGIKNYKLEVHRSNNKAIKLYKKLDFRLPKIKTKVHII